MDRASAAEMAENIRKAVDMGGDFCVGGFNFLRLADGWSISVDWGCTHASLTWGEDLLIRKAEDVEVKQDYLVIVEDHEKMEFITFRECAEVE